jgi:hypothetical protein
MRPTKKSLVSGCNTTNPRLLCSDVVSLRISTALQLTYKPFYNLVTAREVRPRQIRCILHEYLDSVALRIAVVECIGLELTCAAEHESSSAAAADTLNNQPLYTTYPTEFFTRFQNHGVESVRLAPSSPSWHAFILRHRRGLTGLYCELPPSTTLTTDRNANSGALQLANMLCRGDTGSWLWSYRLRLPMWIGEGSHHSKRNPMHNVELQCSGPSNCCKRCGSHLCTFVLRNLAVL